MAVEVPFAILFLDLCDQGKMDMDNNNVCLHGSTKSPGWHLLSVGARKTPLEMHGGERFNSAAA